MTNGIAAGAHPALDVRREFDRIFAAPPAGPQEDRESLIVLRVAGQAFAVRTMHVTAVAHGRRILPVPSRVPGLLGIAALRGALLPVYDLAALLGLPAAPAPGSWLLLANRQTPVGLVFDELEGQVEVDRRSLYEGDRSAARTHLCLMAGVGARAVIDVPGLVAEIRRRAGVTEPGKE